MIEGLCLSS